MRSVHGLVLLAVLAAGCAVNPVSGRPEVVVLSRAQERELGREEAANVATTMGLVEDARLGGYVNAVGDRVAAFSPMKNVAYTFQVVDMPEPNAFALPGGWVYVSRGLLVLLNSEDQLAGVLGHEVGHVAARHAVQRVTRAAPIAIVSGVGSAVTGMVSPLLGNVVGGVGQAANALVVTPYGRDQEREADRVGVRLAAEAGWDPAALAASLDTLEREDRLNRTDASSRYSFFATHPPLPERVQSVRAEARELVRAPVAPIAASPEAFLQRLDGLVVGPSAAEGVFVGRTFVHPDLGVALAFPEGWSARNERQGVGAHDPKRRAMVALEVAGQGDDPAALLARLDAKNGTELAKRAERLEIGGRRAVHVVASARSEAGPLAIDATWIAHRGRVFRILGAARPGAFEAYQPTFRSVARSFHPPTSTERGAVREDRVRLVRVAPGETLARLLVRAGSAWKSDMARIANGLADGEEPAAGRLLKIAVSEPYVRRPQ